MVIAAVLLIGVGYGLMLHGAKLRRDNRSGDVVFIESDKQAAQELAKRPNQQAWRGSIERDGQLKPALVFDPDPAKEELRALGNIFGLGGAALGVTSVVLLAGCGVAVACRRWDKKLE